MPEKELQADDLLKLGKLPHPEDIPVELTAEERRRGARLEDLRAARVGAFLGKAIAGMRDRRDGRSVPVPVPWSRTSEELRGGLWPGCYMLVGATGVGKSQWALEVAYHAITRPTPIPVLYIGLELDRPGLVARLAALGLSRRERKVAWSGLYVGEAAALAELDKAEGRAVVEVLNAAPLYLVSGDARGWPYSELGELVEDIRQEHPKGPVLVILDFLQLVSEAADAGRSEDLRERIGGAAYLARMVARTHGASVLILSATARTNYPLFGVTKGKVDGQAPMTAGKGDPDRFVGTGKESGEVEYAADAVLALCKDPPDTKDRRVWLAVAKARTGRAPSPCRGWVAYNFAGTVFVEDVAHTDAAGKEPAGASASAGKEPAGASASAGKGSTPDARRFDWCDE